MRKLFAGAGKLANVVGIKTTDMRDFLKSIADNIDTRKEEFVNASGEKIVYDNYEVVKALAYYEGYLQEMEQITKEATKKAVANTKLPDISVSKETKVKQLEDIDDECPF